MNRLCALALLAVLALAGCGSDTKGTSSETAEPPAPTVDQTPGSGGTAPCLSNIRVIAGEVSAAAGHRVLALAFNNVGSTPCEMTGYPEVTLVDAAGDVVARAKATLRGQVGVPAGATGPGPVVLAPGGTATAFVEASAVPRDGEDPTCTAYSLLVTPPGQSQAVPAGTAMVPDCDLQVHPALAGDLRKQY